MQSVALGLLGWSPKEFWNSTSYDYFAAIEFHERAAAARERAMKR